MEKERRKNTRIVYKPLKRPNLKIKEDIFEVADISANGIKFLNKIKVQLPSEFNGTLIFEDKTSYDFEGKIIWEKDSSVGVTIKKPIPPEIIGKDNEYIFYTD
jgi:hypothetical protein